MRERRRPPRLSGVCILLLLIACGNDREGLANKTLQVSSTKRTFDITASRGEYALRMYGGMVMGKLNGYLLNGQFLGPTLVADVGDTIEVTLHNQTDTPIGLHPHGVLYDKQNEGMDTLADPGDSVTYTWKAVLGAGTFLYHSHELDENLQEYQGMGGVLGVIVIRDKEEWDHYAPDHMINYVLMNTYAPWTTIDESAMGSGAAPIQKEEHNHTMVVQEVRGDDLATTTMNSLVTTANLGETVRVNVVGFGEQFHTFHMHGYSWNDPASGKLLDTKSLGPAESYYFYLPNLSNPGTWMAHCHVDSHLHMMTTYFVVK